MAEGAVKTMHNCGLDPALAYEHTRRIEKIEEAQVTISREIGEIAAVMNNVLDKLQKIEENQGKISEDISSVKEDVSAFKLSYETRLKTLEDEKETRLEDHKENKKTIRKVIGGIIIAAASTALGYYVKKC